MSNRLRKLYQVRLGSIESLAAAVIDPSSSQTSSSRCSRSHRTPRAILSCTSSSSESSASTLWTTRARWSAGCTASSPFRRTGTPLRTVRRCQSPQVPDCHKLTLVFRSRSSLRLLALLPLCQHHVAQQLATRSRFQYVANSSRSFFAC